MTQCALKNICLEGAWYSGDTEFDIVKNVSKLPAEYEVFYIIMDLSSK